MSGAFHRAGLAHVLAQFCFGFAISVLHAQITFSAGDLLSEMGQRTRAYVGYDLSLSNLVGQTGGPQRWDFSQAPGPGETIHRTEIVPVADAGHGVGFSAAAYAERETGESDGTQVWRYHRINSEGRAYYGFYQPVDAGLPVDPQVVFATPTTDLPGLIQFGQNWSRTVDWVQIVATLTLATHFTANSSADAYGTVVLPGIGGVPALRVKQLNTYEVTLAGTPFGSQFHTNFSWLVKGIGIAAQIIFHVDNLAVPLGPSRSNTMIRVFEVRPGPVADLRIQVEGAQVLLDWRHDTNNSGYAVESIGALGVTNWQRLGEVTTNRWASAVTATQAQTFFRVIAKP